MMTEFEKRVIAFKTTMLMFKNMLEEKAITTEDYYKIEKIMAKKYGINSYTIFR